MVLTLAVPSSPALGQLRLEPMWSVGQVEGPPETQWMRVSDALTYQGRTYVIDIAQPVVRVFDQFGEFVGAVGRQGAGPGEYARPETAVVVGDEVWILDIQLKRVVVLNGQGEHLRTERVSHEPVGAVPWLQRHWRLKSGLHVGATSLVKRDDTGSHYALAWTPGEKLDTLAVTDHTSFQEQYELRDEGGHDRTPLILSSVPYIGPPGGVWPVSDSTFVLLDGERSSVTLFDESAGKAARRREFAIPRPAPEAADSAAAVDWWFYRVGLDRDDTRVLKIVPPLPLPTWVQMLGDDAGHLWLLEGGSGLFSLDSGARWARWSLETGRVSWLEVPPGVTALSFTEGVFVGVRRDEWGVETVEAYRIIEPR
jgi:hypothetical protein